MVCQNVTINVKQTGGNIKKLMSEKNITVKGVAEKLSVSKQTVYKWINGENLPTLDNTVQLSVLFNVTMDSIIVHNHSNAYYASDYYVRSPEYNGLTMLIC